VTLHQQALNLAIVCLGSPLTSPRTWRSRIANCLSAIRFPTRSFTFGCDRHTSVAWPLHSAKLRRWTSANVSRQTSSSVWSSTIN